MGLAASPNVELDVSGEVPDEHFMAYTIDRDMMQPDHAAIVLANQGDIYSDKKVGDSVEIKVGNPPVSIFKGEITMLEPIYKGGEKTRITIRAMNKLHRLTRKRKSLTFADKSDQDILKQVVGDAGLSLQFKHEKSLTYKHVYQHNQTDFEFLMHRAARIGCHVWCVDTTLYVKQPDLSDDLKIELNVDDSSDTAQLRTFMPKLSSASVVKKVTVKGWNPETKELLSGDASVGKSPLGQDHSVTGSGTLGEEETFVVDLPIWSAEEATVLAKARLGDLNLSFMLATAELTGTSGVDLGKTVKITANSGKPSDPFNGKYYIRGITHRHSKTAGFTTLLRLARNAQGGS